MSAKKTPLQVVNEEHGGKEKLVDSIIGLVEKGDEDKDELKQRLLTSSNKKLIRLLGTLKTVHDQYGSRAKLAEAVAAAKGRAKDADYVRKLGTYASTRLLGMMP